jgi:hypothetical protein
MTGNLNWVGIILIMQNILNGLVHYGAGDLQGRNINAAKEVIAHNGIFHYDWYGLEMIMKYV